MDNQELNWKPAEGIPGYSISDTGIVRNDRTGRHLKVRACIHGYLRLRIMANGKKKNFRVHQLVAKAFIPAVPGCNQVNHIDGNKLNARADNLEWVTPAQNQQHSFRTGLVKHKLTPNNVLEIRKLVSGGKKQKEVAELFGVSGANISDIINRKIWGYI